jgi:3-oxoacyl-[acyl-carrier protein] reductase
MNCWIVGGTSGIGAAIFDHLCKTSEAQDQIFATGHDIDVRDQNALHLAARRMEPVQFLVYCAGDNYLDWSDRIDPQAMLDIYDVNCVGLIRTIRACPNLVKVVVIGSDAAWRPMRTSIAYNASKAALHAAVQCIARERASDDFVINVVAPGLISGTDMTQYVYGRTEQLRPDVDIHSYMQDQIPIGRMGEPYEVAEVVRSLLALETPYLNGAIIAMNGAR